MLSVEKKLWDIIVVVYISMQLMSCVRAIFNDVKTVSLRIELLVLDSSLLFPHLPVAGCTVQEAGTVYRL
jgi:hypothetical protein